MNFFFYFSITLVSHVFQAPPPVMLRASMIKSQISDIESLKFKLEGKEESIKDLKRQIKLKVGLNVEFSFDTT